MKAELQTVEDVHKNWAEIRVFWTAFLISGVTTIFLTSKPIWSGIAIGLLITGTIGHIEEVISYQHNKKYRLQINKQFPEISKSNLNTAK